MAKTKKVENKPVDFGDFILYSNDKLDRVINGVMGAQGRLSGGLGKDASAEEILAHYDKLGGLVRDKNGNKIETGTFWDFENQCSKSKISLKVAKKPNEGSLKINTEEVGDKPKKGRKPKEDEE